MDLFTKLKNNKTIPSFLKKKGHFVVDDNIGICLLTALSFKQDNGQYLLITSNLYKAQKISQSLASLVGKDNVLLFPTDELIRAQSLAQSKSRTAYDSRA